MIMRTDIALPSFDDEASLWGDTTPEATIQRLLNWGVDEVAVTRLSTGLRSKPENVGNPVLIVTAHKRSASASLCISVSQNAVDRTEFVH